VAAARAESALPREALAYYDAGLEADRLRIGHGRLEHARTQEILERFLPPPPATVLDAGGGPGVYACWLAARGYAVHLLDAVPLHIEQAREASRAQPDHPLASIELGDARRLAFADASLDAVLLLGPLYHLTDRGQRIAALRDARRVVRPNGLVLAAAISRFASFLYGVFRGVLGDPAFARIVEGDLKDGQHRNPTSDPSYFTTTFFHHPEELRAEVGEAGLGVEALLAVEGPGWLLWDDVRDWSLWDPEDPLRVWLRRVESEPSLLGASAHFLAVGRREEE
jgi:ubiquinone/menaquinone biosynthesis C-methylase UbiE